MYFQFGGEFAIRLQRQIVFFGDKIRKQRLPVHLHHIAHLGGEHVVGALRGRLTDQFCSLFKAWFWQKPGAHLHHCGREGGAGAHEEAFSPANSPSSSPARSSAYSSSQPPTWVVPMKICG